MIALLAAPASAAADPGLRPGISTCSKAYAEDLTALSASARELEAHTPAYSYAVRTTATYECVSYAATGELHRTQRATTAYGTAFGLRNEGEATLLLTNEHVASWPSVTDDDHPVEGVPDGCKRTGDALTIVDDEQDDYPGDDIALERVVADPALDVAILRAHVKLQVIPWQLGSSALLGPRDVVQVKGFPLGAFRATNLGKVISAHNHDEYRDWNHDDFVVDALLSNGNSGSPVLAVSCATGEFELVGIFHAAYSRGSALNVVIAIDQFKDLLRTLRQPEHAKIEHGGLLDAAARKALIDSLHEPGGPPFFSFGSLPASVRVRSDGALVFAVYPAEFPRVTRPVIVLEDLPGSGARFGALGRVYLGGARPLSEYLIDASTRALVEHALEVLRRDALAMFTYRAGLAAGARSRAQASALTNRRRALDRELAAQSDVTAGLAALVAHAMPTGNPITVGQIEAGTAASEPAPVRSPP